MESKSSQKLSRATAATILAASTVAVGLPMQTGAAIVFKDVKQGEYYTDAVYELVNKGVINGYTDGTFKPNRNITRGEAAKMLAVALNLDLSNAKNNSFSDIKSTHMYYKHISVLANAGIINGMPDGTFKPNEIVQRSAMAKMVSLGYKFSLATQLTHPFKDVSTNHYANYYIQTLLNLDITKGTSAVAFSPNAAVTRGQLATFISRASKADAGKPTYIVSNVTADKIYINSVGYTIGPNVRSFIKEANRTALMGAHIEGTFTGMTLTAVSKLTINNSGTASNLYVLDGASSTYNGQLVINGSYIRLKNWTLNGQTLLAETPRKSLASYNVLSNLRIASLTGTGIIDWGTPTNPDDSNLNDSDSGNLNSGSSNNGPYSAKMSTVQKYIDFTNTIVKNLVIEQNRTYIKAATKLPKVTIGRDVENVEIYADMKTLYLEGDTSVTIFGVHDIETVYKNSYYSVHFNTNSHIGTLIVDNSNGWIDLSDYVNIDKVIIPTGKTPNDIFDDYKNDNDNIGIIEDNKGDDVDRDPIENGIIPDVTKPIINDLRVVPDSNQAEVTLTVNETGKYHYLVLPKGATVPTVRDIVSTQSGNSGSSTIDEGHVNSDGKYTKTFIVSGLDSVKEYVIYVVHVDDAGNFSARAEREFATKDGTPPQFMTAKAEGLAGGRRIQFDFKPSETGTYYYFVREQQNIDTTVKVEDIINGAQATGVVTADHVLNGYSEIIKQDENGAIIKPLTKYVVYAVLVDNSGNEIVQPAMLPVTTLALDETAPYVTGPTNTQNQQLIPVNANALNQFYMYFSEKLDKATAENINNYTLTGTGIVNVPGQQPIKPTRVEYSETGGSSTGNWASRILITIPSLTGFVHGDTLRVKVSKEVLDLAEIPFENVDNTPNGQVPRDFADYRHVDPYEPDLLINNVERGINTTVAQITYTATKAGSIYYMILPDSFNFRSYGITPADFVAEFGSNPTTKFNSGVNSKYYLEGNTPAALKTPLTGEIGTHSFIYDYTNLRPSSFESYSVYMVLKDRSGRLSGIQNATMIADKEAPKISSYDFVSATNDDTKANVTLTSDEDGWAYFAYIEKYIKDTTGKYILNPKIQEADTITNYDQFLTTFPTPREVPMEKGAISSYQVTGLTPNKEYVMYLAVRDTFGNYTVKTTPSTGTGSLMKRELYTDGTAPKVTNNIVYRNLDNTFTITFTETIGRKYEDQDPLVKNNLNQISSIKTTTALSDVLTIFDSSGVNDITGKFKLKSYTPGSQITNESKLIIEAIAPNDAEQSFTVNVGMGDQLINSNKPNYVIDIADYKYPTSSNINKMLSADLFNDSNYPIYNTILDASTMIKVGVDLKIDTTWGQNYYYAIINSGLSELTISQINEIISRTNANDNLEISGGGVTSYGKGKITGTSDASSDKYFTALQYNNSPSSINVFRENQRVFLFTLDGYGNVVWATSGEGVNKKNYIEIARKTQ